MPDRCYRRIGVALRGKERFDCKRSFERIGVALRGKETYVFENREKENILPSIHTGLEFVFSLSHTSLYRSFVNSEGQSLVPSVMRQTDALLSRSLSFDL